jgi:hypothetical protein
MGWASKSKKDSKGWRRHVRCEKAEQRRVEAREKTISAKESINRLKRETAEKEIKREEEKVRRRVVEELRERERKENEARRRMSAWGYDW